MMEKKMVVDLCFFGGWGEEANEKKESFEKEIFYRCFIARADSRSWSRRFNVSRLS